MLKNLICVLCVFCMIFIVSCGTLKDAKPKKGSESKELILPPNVASNKYSKKRQKN